MTEIEKIFGNWESVILEHEDEFIKEFCKHAQTLTHVSWNSYQMKIVYILESGQHVTDSVEIDKWFAFLERHNK